MRVIRLNIFHDIYNTFVIRDGHMFKNVTRQAKLRIQYQPLRILSKFVCPNDSVIYDLHEIIRKPIRILTAYYACVNFTPTILNVVCNLTVVS